MLHLFGVMEGQHPAGKRSSLEGSVCIGHVTSLPWAHIGDKQASMIKIIALAHLEYIPSQWRFCFRGWWGTTHQ